MKQLLEQLLFSQGINALHVVVRNYGVKYFSPEELAAFDVSIDALSELPLRINAANPAK